MSVKTILAETLKRRLREGDVLLMDVREPAEYKSGHIEGAYLMPLGDVCVERLPSRTKPIVVYCRSGKRSSEACLRLSAMDSSLDVSSLEGGIVSWQQAGFAVKRLGVHVLPLERQVQIAVGVIAFLGTILGTFVNPIFYILPGFIGAGLVWAGLTGWCGMAKLLTKMPWNR